MRATLVGGLAISAMAVACASHIASSDASDAQPEGGEVADADVTPTCAFDPRGRVPKVHRATAEPCPRDRPPDAKPPLTTPTSPRDNQCASDADCWLLPNGRCVPVIDHNQCTFDRCFDDADCGAAGAAARSPTVGSATRRETAVTTTTTAIARRAATIASSGRGHAR